MVKFTRETLKKINKMDLAPRNNQMALFTQGTGKMTKKMDLVPWNL